MLLPFMFVVLRLHRTRHTQHTPPPLPPQLPPQLCNLVASVASGVVVNAVGWRGVALASLAPLLVCTAASLAALRVENRARKLVASRERGEYAAVANAEEDG